jgi:uncharacterized membrane protein
MFVMQIVYAIFTAQIAKRRHKNVVAYVLVSLIPFVGMFFFIYVMWSTVLWTLDSINELRVRNGAATE